MLGFCVGAGYPPDWLEKEKWHIGSKTLAFVTRPYSMQWARDHSRAFSACDLQPLDAILIHRFERVEKCVRHKGNSNIMMNPLSEYVEGLPEEAKA